MFRMLAYVFYPFIDVGSFCTSAPILCRAATCQSSAVVSASNAFSSAPPTGRLNSAAEVDDASCDEEMKTIFSARRHRSVVHPPNIMDSFSIQDFKQIQSKFLQQNYNMEQNGHPEIIEMLLSMRQEYGAKVNRAGSSCSRPTSRHPQYFMCNFLNGYDSPSPAGLPRNIFNTTPTLGFEGSNAETLEHMRGLSFTPFSIDSDVTGPTLCSAGTAPGSEAVPSSTSSAGAAPPSPAAVTVTSSWNTAFSVATAGDGGVGVSSSSASSACMHSNPPDLSGLHVFPTSAATTTTMNRNAPNFAR
ncbi:unnamed protein product [Schistocephalus solidus]|uniref:Uncharacterized protein n=1 Tax=Schistocephalus solidus TaxID=70667 RepID=A0A183T5H3_SCHSO|nr:unnamed protein product [Schistocephalus solidus]